MTRKSYSDELREKALQGCDKDGLNRRLAEACRQRYSVHVAEQIINAFADKSHIDAEAIVTAAEYGHSAMVDLLTRLIPAKLAQDNYDRALIGAAANHFAQQNEYLAITEMLLRRGANPEAHECSAFKLASGYLDKSRIASLLHDAVESREAVRRRKNTTPGQPKP